MIHQSKTHGTISNVDGRPRTDGHAVGLVDNFVITAIIELGDLDLTWSVGEGCLPALFVPVVGQQEVFDGELCPEVLGLSVWPLHLQGAGATSGPAARPERGEISPVIGV